MFQFYRFNFIFIASSSTLLRGIFSFQGLMIQVIEYALALLVVLGIVGFLWAIYLRKSKTIDKPTFLIRFFGCILILGLGWWFSSFLGISLFNF
jgi:hypothetical protein